MNKAAQALGKLSAEKNPDLHGSDHMKKLAKKSAESRKLKKELVAASKTA